MIGEFFRRKSEKHYPDFLYRLALDMFAVVQCWEPFPISGPKRGRKFEKLFYQHCRQRGLPLTESAGSRTFRGCGSASGFSHESDAVISMPDMTIHLELKHLSQELTKNDLLIFNQKGLDFLASPHAEVRRLPFYRILLSGSLLTPEARTFALQWGILAIEPERLPLILLHWLSGHSIPDLPITIQDSADEIWAGVPMFIVPLQKRVIRLTSLLNGSEALISRARTDKMIDIYQRECGDGYWSILDDLSPNWIERVYEQLDLELDEDRRSIDPQRGRRYVDLFAEGTA